MAKKKPTQPSQPTSRSPAKRAPADIAPTGYADLLAEIKQRVQTAQVRAALAVNRELILLYWEIGRAVVERQEAEGWGRSVIERLAKDLHAAFPGVGGFSPSNVWRMRGFYLAYTADVRNLAQPVRELDGSTLPAAAAEIPWGHNILLVEKLSDPSTRLWYARMTTEQGWSRSVLTMQIEAEAHRRHGKALTNFAATLPSPQSDLARDLLKDPYNFDVRHDNREGIADAVSRTLGRRCLSRPTYLKSKDDREHSLLVKRRLTTKCPDHAPQGLRSTVKATLLELQFHRTSGSPVGRAFDDDADRSGRSNRARPEPQRPG